MMVAKIIIEDQPNIELYPDLGSNLNEIRSLLSYMGYEELGIHFLDIQPGIGKTHGIITLLKEKDSFMVATATHKLLEGEYEKLGARHWKSFRAKCEIYSNVEKIHSLGVPISVICDIHGCKKNKCPYWEQFEHSKAIAPYHYLPTTRVKDGNDFKFDLLMLDEAMTGYNTIKIDLENLKDNINVLVEYVTPKLTSTLSSLVNLLESGEDTFQFLHANLKKINKAKYSSIKKAIKQEKWEHVQQISSLNFFELKKFAYYKSIHNEITSYDEPFSYEILDLARQDIPIIILDASFDLELFRLIYGRYAYEDRVKPRELLLNKELKPLKDIKISVYQSNQKQKDKKIYRMDKNNYYYKTGFFNKDKKLTEYGSKTIDILRQIIKRTQRKYPNVGLVTYQDMIPYFSDLVKTEYFFNLRGSNVLENCEALFIIGTPTSNPIETVKEYNKLAMTDIDPTETYKPFYKKKDGELLIKNPFTGEEVLAQTDGEKIPNLLQPEGYFGSDCPEGREYQTLDLGEVELHLYYSLSRLDYLKSESEQYQAIHRARPLINNKEIYVFGNVPKKIKDEFTIVTMDKKRTGIYFLGSRAHGVYPLSLWLSITRLFYEKELTALDIAKKLRLYTKDKKSYNTKFITEIIKGNVSISDIKKIDKLLKNESEITSKDIKRKYRDLNIEFLEYCILYANEGGFIQIG